MCCNLNGAECLRHKQKSDEIHQVRSSLDETCPSSQLSMWSGFLQSLRNLNTPAQRDTETIMGKAPPEAGSSPQRGSGVALCSSPLPFLFQLQGHLRFFLWEPGAGLGQVEAGRTSGHPSLNLDLISEQQLITFDWLPNVLFWLLSTDDWAVITRCLLFAPTESWVRIWYRYFWCGSEFCSVSKCALSPPF